MTLLPCPFCGKDEARIADNGIGDVYIICGDPGDEESEGCGARTSDYRCESEYKAARLWNQRA